MVPAAPSALGLESAPVDVAVAVADAVTEAGTVAGAKVPTCSSNIKQAVGKAVVVLSRVTPVWFFQPYFPISAPTFSASPRSISAVGMILVRFPRNLLISLLVTEDPERALQCSSTFETCRTSRDRVGTSTKAPAFA